MTRDELLTELARREQEYRQDFERLVDAQEKLRGQLLSVFGRFAQRRAFDALGVELAPLERRQRNIASSVNVVRQQFAQILAALTVNQLDTSDQRERLENGIIEPLGRLVRRDLVTAADTLRQWAREKSPERASLVDPQQARLAGFRFSVGDFRCPLGGLASFLLARTQCFSNRNRHQQTPDIVPVVQVGEFSLMGPEIKALERTERHVLFVGSPLGCALKYLVRQSHESLVVLFPGPLHGGTITGLEPRKPFSYGVFGGHQCVLPISSFASRSENVEAD